MQRFFVSPELMQQSTVTLAGGQAHQMRRVLRLEAGSRVTLLDNSGRAYDAQLLGYGRDDVRLAVLGSREAESEPVLHVTLYQAVPKGERFEWLLQKGTEVGISRFVPLVCARSVVEDRRAIAGKRGRWQRIIQEAAEQSGRGLLPELAAPCGLAEALGAGHAAEGPVPSANRLIAWEGERALGLAAALAGCNLLPGASIQVFVGPEGGLTAEEIALAVSQGVRPVSLGPRILRAETAGLVAASAILYQAGDLAPRRAQGPMLPSSKQA